MIEQDDSDSIILAATNHPNILDYALFRRFDDVIEFTLPGKSSITKLLKNRLSIFKTSRIAWNKLASEASGLSFADITKICEDGIKDTIIHDLNKLTENELLKLITERKKLLSKQGPSNQQP